jgi:MazG nucleotide pyrophosphohydrolase domain.
MSWDTNFDDRYAEMAAVVADGWEMNEEYSGQVDYQAQLNVALQELGELSDAIMKNGVQRDPGRQIVGGELADVLITIHLLAVQMGINPWEHYRSKQKYNMNKSGSKSVGGKILDNA